MAHGSLGTYQNYEVCDTTPCAFVRCVDMWSGALLVLYMLVAVDMACSGAQAPA